MVDGVEWSIQLDQNEVWQRQAVILSVDAIGHEPYARLKLNEPDLPGIQAVELEFSRQAIEEQTKISQRWALFPQQPGQHTLTLPQIRYTGGRKVIRWQPPGIPLQVKALPPYLSPTTPIGELEFVSTVQSGHWIKPDELSYWHIRVQSTQVRTGQFPALLKQIQNNNHFVFFPPAVEQSIEITDSQALSYAEYQIPFKARHSGLLQLPSLQWHWLDPKTGKLRKENLQTDPIWVLSTFWRGSLSILSSFFLLSATWTGGKFVSKQLKRFLSKVQVLKLQKHIPDYPSFKQAMDNVATTHHWPSNLSDGQWLKRWEKHYGATPWLHEKLSEYQQQRFSQS